MSVLISVIELALTLIAIIGLMLQCWPTCGNLSWQKTYSSLGKAKEIRRAFEKQKICPLTFFASAHFSLNLLSYS